MKANKSDIDIEERIDNGWIHIRFSIEIQGNNKEHVEKSLNNLVDSLAEKKFAIVMDTKLDTTEEISNGWYSNFIEVEAMIEGFNGMVNVATQLSPTTLEVLAPNKISIPANQLQTSMIDIASLISTFAHAAYLARKQFKALQPGEKPPELKYPGGSPPEAEEPEPGEPEAENPKANKPKKPKAKPQKPKLPKKK